MKKVLFLMIACTALFTACKKDKEKTTAEKVLGRWKVTNTVENEFYNNTAHITTQAGIASDYVDFREDGKVYSKDGNDPEYVSAYTITGDDKITFDGETYDIKTLTDNQFVLYNKYVYPNTPSNYDEITYNLYK